VKITKQRLKEIIKEELGRDPELERAAAGELREPWLGIEENAERLDILSNQISKLARALNMEL
jgi:hypothetical protein